MSQTKMNKRIPVSDETIKRLRDFADGLGTTYDDTINFLIDCVAEENESAKLTGHRLRSQFDPALRMNQQEASK